ncbi:MAG: lasso peptide biosynthesis B2 protein [Rubrivivax sp.]|nr:lasso peptide biosynthesis B2 protein [Rubrivivax sp.]
MDNVDDVKQPTLRLAGHVRTCAMSDQVVLLDLRRNRYLALGLKQWEILSGTTNMPPVGRPGGREDRQDDIRRLSGSLLRQGILTSLPNHGAHDDAVQSPDSSLDVRGATPYSAIGANRVWRFMVAATWAAAALRLRSLRSIVDHVARRSSRLDHPEAAHQAGLRDAVAAFEALRPLMFTARDKCLYDSLALACFMASEGLKTQWVIGVKTQPFAAHSWVQAGTVVLNDLHENVRSFKPILVV